MVDSVSADKAIQEAQELDLTQTVKTRTLVEVEVVLEVVELQVRMVVKTIEEVLEVIW
jgi:hypothetical protein